MIPIILDLLFLMPQCGSIRTSPVSSVRKTLTFISLYIEKKCIMLVIRY